MTSSHAAGSMEWRLSGQRYLNHLASVQPLALCRGNDFQDPEVAGSAVVNWSLSDRLNQRDYFSAARQSLQASRVGRGRPSHVGAWGRCAGRRKKALLFSKEQVGGSLIGRYLGSPSRWLRITLVTRTSEGDP